MRAALKAAAGEELTPGFSPGFRVGEAQRAVLTTPLATGLHLAAPLIPLPLPMVSRFRGNKY